MRSKILKQISAWLPVILWSALIFKFSSGTIPKASPVFWEDFAVKKTGHILLFGALSLFLYRALRMNNFSKKKSAILAVIITIFYGASDEFHQTFTQGRTPRIRDVFIDGVGATLVTLATYYLPDKVSKKNIRFNF